MPLHQPTQKAQSPHENSTKPTKNQLHASFWSRLAEPRPKTAARRPAFALSPVQLRPCSASLASSAARKGSKAPAATPSSRSSRPQKSKRRDGAAQAKSPWSSLRTYRDPVVLFVGTIIVMIVVTIVLAIVVIYIKSSCSHTQTHISICISTYLYGDMNVKIHKFSACTYIHSYKLEDMCTRKQN